MINNNPDWELVKRVQQGDTRAFEVLVLKYQNKVINLVSRFVRDGAEAEDVAQETFIKAYRAIANFRGDSAFYTWLYRIAINTAKNFIVAAGRRPPTSDMDVNGEENVDSREELAEIATPELQLQRRELEEAIQRAIAELPEDLRMALTLCELEGLSYEEIAKVMDTPIGTVRSRIFRARQAVDEHLKPYLDGGIR